MDLIDILLQRIIFDGIKFVDERYGRLAAWIFSILTIFIVLSVLYFMIYIFLLK
jgi:hypothetical protein